MNIIKNFSADEWFTIDELITQLCDTNGHTAFIGTMFKKPELALYLITGCGIISASYPTMVWPDACDIPALKIVYVKKFVDIEINIVDTD